MATGIIDIVKRAALDAIANEQMCDLRYGTVSSVDPLQVQVSSQLTIPSSLLVVPEHLTDRSIPIYLDLKTDKGGQHSHELFGNAEADGFHFHYISSEQKLTIRNALKVGDKVAMLRKQGGQSYFILDRI